MSVSRLRRKEATDASSPPPRGLPPLPITMDSRSSILRRPSAVSCLALPALLAVPFLVSSDDGVEVSKPQEVEVPKLREVDPPEKTVTLYVHPFVEEDGLVVEARLGDEEAFFQIAAPPKVVREELEKVSSGQETGEYAVFEAALKSYGAAFFDPLAELLAEATEVQFVLAGEELLTFPFDLLHFGDRPLFLQKPVSYGFDEVEKRPCEFDGFTKNLLVSDVTADPERAVETVREMLPDATYFDIADADPATFAALAPLDLVLVSAHGDVSPGRTDSMRCGRGRLRPECLEGLSPRLVYFDSCSLGVSFEFIETFLDQGVQFYAGPIFSNEAGNSSTKTMVLFFQALRRYDDPVHAMFLTRRQLHAHFADEESPLVNLFRSFPFRVYRF